MIRRTFLKALAALLGLASAPATGRVIHPARGGFVCIPGTIRGDFGVVHRDLFEAAKAWKAAGFDWVAASSCLFQFGVMRVDLVGKAADHAARMRMEKAARRCGIAGLLTKDWSFKLDADGTIVVKIRYVESPAIPPGIVEVLDRPSYRHAYTGKTVRHPASGIDYFTWWMDLLKRRNGDA